MVRHPAHRTRPLPNPLRYAPGIDQQPFEVDLHEDPVNPGGLCVKDRWGLWNRVEALYPRESVEWWME